MWDLPNSTHKSLLEPLSPVPHLESALLGRYIGFIDSLSKSSKPLIKILYRNCISNVSTNTGQNLKYLMDKYSKWSIWSLISEKNTIKKSTVNPTSTDDSWKVKLIEEISLAKKSLLEVDFDEQYLEEILTFACTD